MHRFTLGPSLVLAAILMVMSGCEPDVSEDPEVLERLPETVDFNFHIKPILSDRCFACHGPDEAAREADLRLDIEEIAKGHELQSGGHAISEGSLRKSEVYRRLTSDDPDVMMPPPGSNLQISEYEKALIFRWIRQGAEYKRHWSFLPPTEPEEPEVEVAAAVNEIDRFVVARLEQAGLRPSPEADRERLLRRVTMDLTGLPPTIEEIDAFLNDGRSDAYERVVDRLLDSKAYAERMANEWMDVSRYADSHGYHADGYRYMWPWRDWVIEAFDQNMPYDRFVTWQLAGDLLPNATREQILATGFNRNHPMTAEGGVVDEEYRVAYVVDRTNTFGRAFLGLTVECAQCHDHKYDPITQKNYYQLSAFFDNVDEVGMTADDDNAGPLLQLPDKATEAQVAELRRAITDLEAELEAHAAEAGALQPEGAGGLPRQDDAAAHFPLDALEEGGGLKISGEPELVDGPRGKAVRFRGDFDFLSLEKTGLFERYQPFSIAVWVRPDIRDQYAEILGNAGQKNSYWRGHEMYLDSLNRVAVRLTNALPHNLLHVRTVDSIGTGAWSHLALTYDGSSRADGLRLYVDGRAVETDVLKDNLYKSIIPVDGRFERDERPLRVGKSYRGFSGDDGIFKGAVDDIRVYDRRLTDVDVALLHGDAPLLEALEGPPAQWDARTERAAREHARHARDERYRTMLARLRDLRRREHEVVEEIPEVMVMEEMEKPRPTYLLFRGAYDAPAELVEPGTPEALLAFPEDLPRNRLGLARWLFAEENPLAARVAVNRYWAMFFGTGLVETIEDFGSQGALPSHPELLDYLALRFRDSGWDVKALVKHIVTSATYRQSSRLTDELRRLDPDNRLLARGPSYRLPFEMIRDNALFASGLLVDSVGGPSVKPYQPPGLWEEKGVFSPKLLTFEQDHGDDLYRRSLYTFIRRTAPPPAMTAFDVPDRNICVVRRQTTNTPMQALVLLNDPQFVEAARVLAERIQKETGPDLRSRLTRGYRLVTGRTPSTKELEVFEAIYREERLRFEADRGAAAELLTVGEYPRDADLDVVETAALAVTSSVMMNTDDFYSKR